MDEALEYTEIDCLKGQTAIPHRIVDGYEDVRTYLDHQLADAEVALGVDTSRVKLMPYVIVVDDVGKQRILPMGINRAAYSHTRNAVETGNPDDHLGTGCKGDLGSAYIRALREYDLGGCGVLVNDDLQGIVFSQTCACRGDVTFPVIGEHYGPYTAGKANLYVYGDQRDYYEGRGSLSFRTHALVTRPGSGVIVTLGPPDDIVGILKGDYTFQEGNWIPKK